MALLTVLSTAGGAATFVKTGERTEEYSPGTTWHTVYYYYSYQLTATPDSGYVFSSWTKAGTSGTYSKDNPLTIEFLDHYVTHPGTQYETTYQGPDQTFTAVFNAVIPFTVATESSPVMGGTTTGGGQYTSGSFCTVSATPANGYEFIRWVLTTGATSKNTSFRFQVTQNITATAYFRQYTGLPLYGSSGTILCNSSGKILCDA